MRLASLNTNCEEHGCGLVANRCPHPACTPESQVAVRGEGGVQVWTRTLPRTSGVYQWKIVRGKGRCIPCEKARQANR